MPITFSSIEDPLGIRSAGSSLASALMNRNLLDRQERSQIAQEQRVAQRSLEAENRAQALKRQYGELLGPALAIAQDSSASPQQRLGALQNYITQTGDTSVLPLLKEVGRESQASQLLQMLGLTGQPMGTSVQTQQLRPNQVDQTTTTPSLKPNSNGLGGANQDQLVALYASGNPILEKTADAEFKRRGLEQTQFNEERKYHERGAKTAEDKVRGLRTSLPLKEMSLNLARDAILSNEVGRFTLANLAERTGIKEFQTSKGAQLLTAGKENLIGNLSNVSAKAQNQWLEQRFSSMFPEIGKSKEANLTIQEMLEGNLEMDKVYVENFDKIAEEDLNKYGFVRRDIDKRAEEASRAQYDDIMDKVSFRTRQIYEQEKGASWLLKHAKDKVAKGTILTPQMAKVLAREYNGDFSKAIENAEKLGYRIPTLEEAQQWQ